MTLRLRLLSALTGVAVIVVVAFGVVVVRQHAVLLHPIDDQLRPVTANLSQAESFFKEPDQPVGDSRLGPPTGELYLAIHEAGTDPQLLARPDSDPSFTPDVDVTDLASRRSVTEPFTIGAAGDGRARVVAHDLGQGRWVVAALSTRAVEEAQRDLLSTAAVVFVALLVALGLVMYLVDRLGIKPILEVTSAAEELANKGGEPRVDVGALSTEAGRLGLSFNKMLDAHQAADAQQRRFVADASHELRTPLTTLQGYAAL